jgi:hypothetical protein
MTPTVTIGQWKAMLRRCEYPRDTNYRNYGARGISVCERWHDYDLYAADILALIGPRPEGMTLDRINNDGNYEPGNVRWATARQQVLNSRAAGPRPYRPRPRKLRHDPYDPFKYFRRPADACYSLGVSGGEFMQLVLSGQLPAITINAPGTKPRLASFRVSEAALAEFIAQGMAIPS